MVTSPFQSTLLLSTKINHHQTLKKGYECDCLSGFLWSPSNLQAQYSRLIKMSSTRFSFALMTFSNSWHWHHFSRESVVRFSFPFPRIAAENNSGIGMQKLWCLSSHERESHSWRYESSTSPAVAPGRGHIDQQTSQSQKSWDSLASSAVLFWGRKTE